MGSIDGYVLGLATVAGCAGACIVAVTMIIAQRLGGTAAGVIATIPLPSLVASVSLTLVTNDTQKIQTALLAAPSVGLLQTIYLLISWVWVPLIQPETWNTQRRFRNVACIAVLVWSVLCLPFVFVIYPAIVNSVDEDRTSLQAIAICALYMNYHVCSVHALTWSPPSTCHSLSDSSTRGRIVCTRKICLQAAAGFVVMFLVTVLGKLDGTLGGALSVFPAVGTVNQVLLWTSMDQPNQAIAASSAMTMGNIGVYSYAVIYATCIGNIGIAGSGAIAFVTSFVLFNQPIFYALRRHNKNLFARASNNNDQDTDEVCENFVLPNSLSPIDVSVV